MHFLQLAYSKDVCFYTKVIVNSLAQIFFIIRFLVIRLFCYLLFNCFIRLRYYFRSLTVSLGFIRYPSLSCFCLYQVSIVIRFLPHQVSLNLYRLSNRSLYPSVILFQQLFCRSLGFIRSLATLTLVVSLSSLGLCLYYISVVIRFLPHQVFLKLHQLFSRSPFLLGVFLHQLLCRSSGFIKSPAPSTLVITRLHIHQLFAFMGCSASLYIHQLSAFTSCSASLCIHQLFDFTGCSAGLRLYQVSLH